MAHRSRIPGRRGSSVKNFGPEDPVFNVKTNSFALQSNPPVIGNSAGADLEQCGGCGSKGNQRMPRIQVI